jgi:hypothetical protein
MRIATVMNIHADEDLILDTVDSIRKYVGDKILLVVDGARWNGWGDRLKVPAHKVAGLYHNYHRAPYRNVTFGFMNALKMWGNEIDWICYVEPDALFLSDSFKQDLYKAEKKGVWCLGNDVRTTSLKFTLLENMLNREIPIAKYLLGCCVFYHINFFRTLLEINFFERFLYLTNNFSDGFFPGYEEQGGYDFAEHLYPTLANLYGGGVKGMAFWEDAALLEPGMPSWGNGWYGNRKYMMRWRPDITLEEKYPEAAILHPSKDFTSSLRVYCRNKRRD